MKASSHCKDCLKDLARRVVALSDGSKGLVASAFHLIEAFFDPERSPTEVSNRLLRYIKAETGVYDPFAERKETEFRQALAASARLKDFFPDTLEGALAASAFGNGGDFFTEHAYDPAHMEFEGDVAKIERQVYINSKIMVLGDNPGDLVFDLPLLRLLRREGKEVYYAVKEHPVQNDMSLADAARLGAHDLWDAIISAGTERGRHQEGSDDGEGAGVLGRRQHDYRQGHGELRDDLRVRPGATRRLRHGRQVQDRGGGAGTEGRRIYRYRWW